MFDLSDSKKEKIRRCVNGIKLAKTDFKKTKLVEELREYALSRGGFLDDSIRRQAWPVLLNL